MSLILPYEIPESEAYPLDHIVRSYASVHADDLSPAELQKLKKYLESFPPGTVFMFPFNHEDRYCKSPSKPKE